MQFMVRLFTRGACLLLLTFATLSVPALGTGSAQAQTIGSVVVEGNQRVDAATVENYLTLKRGDSYNAFQADESLKTLFATGLFSDVNINMRGSSLVVSVTENPVINLVSFEGNDKLKDNQLQEVVESESRGVLTRATVQNDVVRVLRAYRTSGRFGARVEPKIIDLPDNRVNLVFEIDEGDKTSVVRINFVGNNAFSDRHLKDVITTSEKNWLSWLKSSDVYDPERVDADEAALRNHYLNNGYADFRVISSVADFDRERNSFFLTFTVEEGIKYQFGNVDVESYVPDIDPEMLRRVMSTHSGETYSAEKVDESLEEMTFVLANSGYAFAQVRPRGNRNYDAQTIDLTYVVEEGPRVYVERIEIRGNTRTLDTVVRREFDFAEGDAYNQVMINRAKKRLDALRYFETVNISREPGSAQDRVVVVVNVVEQPTGELSLGGGYSTSAGFLADVSITERNLLGRGQILRLGGALGERQTSFDFGFTEPYFLGRRLAAGVDAFYRDIDYSDVSSYQSETIGGGVRLGFALTEEINITTRYQLYQTDITLEDGRYNDNCPPICTPSVEFPNPMWPEASIGVKQSLGKSLYSVIGYDITYSTIDSYTRPSEGLYLKLSQNLAGLGGDVNFIRTEAEARTYHELRPDLIAMIKLRGGHIAGWGGDDVRVTDSFMMGGNLVRGFDTGGFGPRDLTPGIDDPLGGKMYAGATAELQFPIPFIPDELGFSAAVFADAGVVFDVGDTGSPGGPYGFLPECVAVNGQTGIAPAGAIHPNSCYVDDTALRASVGLSLLWDSPFGPIRGDFGYAVLKEEYDETQVFRFGTSKEF